MMEVVVVGGIIQVLLQYFLSSTEKIKLVLGFKKDLTSLEDSLLITANFLDTLSVAEVQQVSKEAIQLWLELVENVAYEVEAILDEFNDELRRRESKETGEIKVMKLFSTGYNNLLFGFKMDRRIKDVSNKLRLMNKKVNEFSLHTKPVELVTPVEQTDTFLTDPNIVGRENDVTKLVEMLISAPPDQETLPGVSIIGMGGMGKTTLARKVFQDESIRSHFAKRIWVNVSGNLSVMTSLKMILKTLADEKDEVNGTEKVVLKKILKHLEGKRYLLVLDDVWNENYENWDGFIRLLSNINSVKGNCVIITTRKETTSPVAKMLPTHRLSTLSNDECWSIVKSKILPREDLRFERMGNCIAQRCGGSPLVAEEVGNLLHGKSIDEWLFILENQFSNLEPDKENHVRNMLKLVYDHMPSLRKKRFAYFSMFPQDIKIKRKHLIMLWMAEEYLQVGQGSYMEVVGSQGGYMGNVGIRFFNYLFQKSLLGKLERNLPHATGELVRLNSNNNGADIGATIHVVLQNLRSVRFEEIKVMFGFKKHLTKLENSLIRIQDVISDPEVKQADNRAIKCWLEQLEAVAFETDAILYEFSYLHLRKIVKNQNRDTKKVASYLPFASPTFFFNREMTRKIKDVNAKLEMMSKHVDTLGLEMTIIKSIQPPFWGF